MSRQQLVKIALKVANQLIIIITVIVEHFHLDDLISLKEVVYGKFFLEIGAMVVLDGFRATDALPLEVFLRLYVNNAEGVTFTSHAGVAIDQPAALDRQRDFMGALDQVHGLRMLLDLIFTHNRGCLKASDRSLLGLAFFLLRLLGVAGSPLTTGVHWGV